MIIKVFPPKVVGILKPSITFSSLGLLQLAPVCSSSLQFAPAHSSLLQLTLACSPVCSSLLPPCPLAPYTPEVVGTTTHTLAIGSELEQAGSELGESWSEGSDLGVREASFNLLPPCPLPPCPQRWWGSQYILSCSLDIGSEVQQAGSEGSDESKVQLSPTLPPSPFPPRGGRDPNTY